MKARVVAIFIVSLFVIPFSISNSGGNNYSITEYSPHFGIHVDDPALIDDVGGVDTFVNECKSKGYDAIILNVIPWEYYFYSPTLSSLGWEYAEDMLGELSSKCRQEGIKLIVDLQSLAYKVRESHPDWPGRAPNEDELRSIVDELLSYGIYGISEEMFPASWFKVVSAEVHKAGAIYIHKFIPYDVAWLCMDNSSVFDAFPYADVIMTEDYYLNSDFLRWEMAAGLADKLWIKSSTADWALGMENIKNVLAMRIAQYHPQYVFLMIYEASNFHNFSPHELSFSYSYNVEGSKTMNVVTYLTDEPGDDENMKDFDPWQLFDVSYAAIAEGAGAAGYKVKITRYPMQNADAYYIYTRGGWWGENVLELPENITSLFYTDKPVFIEPAGTLPLHGEWEKIRAIFGIKPREFDIIMREGNAIYGMLDGIRYRHLSDSWFYVNNITTDDVTGNVISRGKIGGKEYALIISSGNKYFINGAGLHEEAGFAISKLLADTMQFPCNAAINVGEQSAILAFSDTNLSLKLPHDGFYEYKAIKPDGSVEDGITGRIFNYSCSEGELIFLTRKVERVNVSIIKPDDGIYINDRKIISYSMPIIIGKITVEAVADNAINVSFYVDGVLKYNDNAPPYSWQWDEFAIGEHEIKVVARSEFNSSYDKKDVWAINLK